MYQFDSVAWGLGLIGIGLGILGLVVPFTLNRLAKSVSVPAVFGGFACLAVGGIFLFNWWNEIPNVTAHPATELSSHDKVAPAPTTQAGEEQSVYFEAIRCVYASCNSGACLIPFRNRFPSSALMPSLEAAAANAATSPNCKTATVSAQQPAVKPIRIPDCGASDSQQKMLPVIRRWLIKQVDETNALTGGAVRVGGIQVLSSRSLFGGQCSVNAIGVIVKGQNQSTRVPIDNLLVNLNYDNNGALTVQTDDGVK